ncbi:MAG: ArsR/SmtB family transcription factor [Candidatus Cryosericum sp.]|jgi:ArsR family transcriptional regulator, arsenate/arsenite/antimonite-responsive transcriptional repressor
MDERVPSCGTQDIVADWNSDCEERAKLVSVLLEPQRIKVLRLLRGGELCVCEIEHSLGIPQNLVSHHLRVLREAGLVAARKEGQFVHYSRVEERVHEVTVALEKLLSH